MQGRGVLDALESVKKEEGVVARGLAHGEDGMKK